MAEGGNPIDEARAKIQEFINKGKPAEQPRTYAERLEDHYESGRLKRPAPRPSGMAGIAPSIEPSGNGGQILLNPLNRKDGGDVNLDAMRFALTKGK